jgi:hypothetical protein
LLGQSQDLLHTQQKNLGSRFGVPSEAAFLFPTTLVKTRHPYPCSEHTRGRRNFLSQQSSEPFGAFLSALPGVWPLVRFSTVGLARSHKLIR